MATLVNRTIWHRSSAKIHSAIVTRQVFNPDVVYAMRDDGVELQLSPSSFFLTPQEAIADARDEAELILYFADQLEVNLQKDEESLWFHRICIEKQKLENNAYDGDYDDAMNSVARREDGDD
jgi:hypothetical protein